MLRFSGLGLRAVRRGGGEVRLGSTSARKDSWLRWPVVGRRVLLKDQASAFHRSQCEFPIVRHFASAAAKDEEEAQKKEKKKNEEDSRDATAGGGFFSTLMSDIKAELEKDKELAENINTLRNKAGNSRSKETEKQGESIDRFRKAREELSERFNDPDLQRRFGEARDGISDRLKDPLENLGKRTKGAHENINKGWSRLRDAADESEYVKGAAKRLKESQDQAKKAGDRIAKTSVFQSLAATFGDTLSEAKADIFGDDTRSAKGREARRERMKAAREWRKRAAAASAGAFQGDAASSSSSSSSSSDPSVDADSDGGEEGHGDAEMNESETVSLWAEAIDPESGDKYYYNVETGETSWENPEELSGDVENLTAASEDSETARDVEEGDAKATTKDEKADTTEILVVKETAKSWERVKDALKNTPLIQDILGAASHSAENFGKTEAGKKAKAMSSKISDTREDLRETWETSQNPWVYRFASAYDNVFSETETGQAIKELRRLDPDWDLHDWLNDIEVEVAPDVLQAYLDGNEQWLASMCAQTALAQLRPELTERRVKGYVRDPNILDIRNVTLLKTRLMERAPPILVLSFVSQQIFCVKNARGKIIEGADDKVMAHVYLMAMQRDWDDEEDCLKWKILEFSPQGSTDFY